MSFLLIRRSPPPLSLQGCWGDRHTRALNPAISVGLSCRLTQLTLSLAEPFLSPLDLLSDLTKEGGHIQGMGKYTDILPGHPVSRQLL